MQQFKLRRDILKALHAGEKLQVKPQGVQAFEDFDPLNNLHSDSFLCSGPFCSSEWRIKPKTVKVKRTIEVEVEVPEPFGGELYDGQEYWKLRGCIVEKKVNWNTECGKRHVKSNTVFLTKEDAEAYAEYLNQSGE